MPKLPLDDPLDWFELWLGDATEADEPQPTAMSLATVDSGGQPSVRIVLLKSFDRKGFVFYTNLESRKARQLADHPRAGLCFVWNDTCRQVRIDGEVKPVADQEADAYFATRPRGSQIGAWASKQSRPLKDRNTLGERVEHFRDRFDGRPVPRPPFWSGYRVIPEVFEFWRRRDDRLHDRWEFRRRGEGWTWQRGRLYP